MSVLTLPLLLSPLLIFLSYMLSSLAVAAWIALGLVWELIEVVIEGFGDASSVRIACYLVENYAKDAHLLSQRIVMLTVVLSLSIFSFILMAGPNVVVAMINDATLQNIMSETIEAIAVASVALAFAQMYWNLLTAQGNFSRASLIVLLGRWFIIAPMALVCIFKFKLSLSSVASAIIVGYITTAIIQAAMVYSTNWYSCTTAAKEAREREEEENLEDAFDPEIDDDDDDDESSDDEDL
jgi:Na+-driven multidrug efflux pump